MGLFSFFNKELAIDLGTANTVIIYNDKVVVDEPSIVAIERDTQKIMAVGKRAMMMHGKTHENIKTVRPLRDGVIADFQAAECMLRDLIKMINFHNSIFPPALKMVICIPSGITEVEERAVKDSAEQAGAKEVRLIHEPMAAAIGIGIDVLAHRTLPAHTGAPGIASTVSNARLLASPLPMRAHLGRIPRKLGIRTKCRRPRAHPLPQPIASTAAHALRTPCADASERGTLHRRTTAAISRVTANQQWYLQLTLPRPYLSYPGKSHAISAGNEELPADGRSTNHLEPSGRGT